MKQEIVANRGQIKKTPKIFFWRYYLYVLLLAIVIAIATVIIKVL
jgi:hypothetical protein